MSEKKLKILFVINAGSGKKKGPDWRSEIEQYYSSLQHHIKFFELPCKNSTVLLKKLISDFYPNKVVAVGGDGTVSFAGKQLIGKNIELGILPAGSANGMAKELNIGATPAESLDIVMNCQAKPTDVIKLNDHIHCLHLADVGINAQLVKYFEEGPIRGKLGYGLALVKAFLNKRRINVTIYAKDNTLKRSAILVIIANASKYGTGAIINPVGDIHDGFFEVIVVKKIRLPEIFKMFLKSQTFNPEHIETISASSILIETKGRAHFQVDGEYLGKVNRVSAHIVPGALRVLMPE